MAEDTPKKKAAAKRAAPKKTTAGRTSAGKTGARSSAPKKAAPRRATPSADEPVVDRFADEEELPSGEPTSARPVAVAGSGVTRVDEPAEPSEGSVGDPDGAPAFDEPVEPAPFEATATGGPIVDEIERPWNELGVGLLAAALAVLTFLPWYRGAGIEASGWSSGAWGPVVTTLAVAAVAIVALRRAGVKMAFPVHHALVLEGIGWVSVALLLIKRFMAPRIGVGEMSVTLTMTVALIVALGIALLAGTVSQGVAVVMRPGWLSGAAGKIGTGILALALVVGGAFGFLNDVGFGAPSAGGRTPVFEEGYPACAENVGVPIPEAVNPLTGAAQEAGFCVATLESSRGAKKTQTAYRRSFKEAGWGIVYDSSRDKNNSLHQVQAQRGEDCASVTIQAGLQGVSGTRITLIIGPPNIACNLGERIGVSGGN